MPKIAEIEYTPNPNARKFTMREPLSWGMPHSYENAAQAAADELARALFAVPHVTNVFYVDRWVTVTQDGEADWDQLVREIATVLRAAPAASEQTAATLAAAEDTLAGLSERDRDRLDEIELLLDQQIRPYLRGDGGDLHVVGLEGNLLTVHYHGACGTCPSSISGTLRGIENLLRSIEPEIEVVSD